MMRLIAVGRLLLALVFAAIAAYCLYAYATMPYELVTTTSTYTRAMPGGDGFVIVALLAGVAALVAAFSGSWHG